MSQPVMALAVRTITQTNKNGVGVEEMVLSGVKLKP